MYGRLTSDHKKWNVVFSSMQNKRSLSETVQPLRRRKRGY